MMNRPGFSMLETMVVVLIIALMAGAVMIKPAGWFQSVQLDDAIDRVVFMDHLARQCARGPGGAVELVYDLENGRILRRVDSSDSLSGHGHHRVSLPKGYAIERMMIRNMRIEGDRAVVRFTPLGHAPTYALRIVGPDDQTAWLLVAGLSGDAWILESTAEVEHALETLRT